MSVVKQQKFTQILKESVMQTLFHKKALLLLSFVLFTIWSTYDAIEYQINGAFKRVRGWKR